MRTVRLDGCVTSPLGSYLKALGVLRLVGEQADATARAWWEDDTLTLSTSLDEDDLLGFFLDRYEPSPVISPWNSDGGFSRSGKRTSEKVLAAVSGSTNSRLAPYQQAITAAWMLVDDPRWESWDKRTQVQACRNRLPDRALDWLDASAVLSDRDDGKPDFPPILGTGGNLGRFELSSNFMQRLLDVLGEGRATIAAPRRGWLEKALFDRGRPAPVEGGIGQYAPGQAASGRVNPWDLVLLIEGALLFASGVARAAGSDGRSYAAMSFMVRSVPVGHDTPAVGEKAKGEIWAPLWSQPTGLAEVRRLFREGRLRLGRQDARTGLDAARAAATLGVDRGVDAFARYVLVERFGQSIFAVPSGRLRVTERPEVSTLGTLDGWLNRVRAAGELPAHVAGALRAVEQAEFEVSARGGSGRLLDVLAAVAELHTAISRSGRVRKEVPPLSGLRARHWLPHITQLGAEFELAAAFASLRATTGECLRELLTPVMRKGGRLEWTDQPADVQGFTVRPLVDVLAEAHTVRMIRQTQERRAKNGNHTGEVPAPFEHGRQITSETVGEFLAGRVDTARVGHYLAALMLLDWQDTPGPAVDSAEGLLPTEPAWRLLAPFYAGLSVRPSRSDDEAEAENLQPGRAWARLLQIRAMQDVAEDAVRRLRAARLRPLVAPKLVKALDVDTHAVSAALLLRLPRKVARDALERCATEKLPF